MIRRIALPAGQVPYGRAVVEVLPSASLLLNVVIGGLSTRPRGVWTSNHDEQPLQCLGSTSLQMPVVDRFDRDCDVAVKAL